MLITFKKALYIFTILIIFTNITYATSSEQNAYYVCFTPGENCTARIVDMLDKAQSSVYLQAYSFTSAPIAEALVKAKIRNVQVKVILDKSQVSNNKYSSATFLQHKGITTYIDYRPAIAHNKIIIIDEANIITGSFNFTKAAQEKNAENVLFIHNKELATKYLENWKIRKNNSILAYEYLQFKALHKHSRTRYVRKTNFFTMD